MKINMPVTDVEYSLTAQDSVVSKTDLKGKITYINTDFLRISGFSKEELIGAAHNIIRHPDMPPEAFKDMWQAQKAARPWTGVIKNRCKNGDYYWVLTNVTPICENDRVIGYLSVRNKPSPQQIETASAAYRLFREDKASHLKIQDGKVITARHLEFNKLSIKTRLAFVIALLSLMILAVGSIGLLAMSKANEGLQTVYEQRMIPETPLGLVQKLLLTNRLRIITSFINPAPEVIQKNITEVEQNRTEIARIWDVYLSAVLPPAEKKLTEKLMADSKRLDEQGLWPAIAALRSNDMTQATSLTNTIAALYEPIDGDIQSLLQVQTQQAKLQFDTVQSHYAYTQNSAIALIATGIILALCLGMILTRSIVRPLDAMVGYLWQLAQGNYTNSIEIERTDEIGKVLEALKSMQTKLGFDITESKRIADENLRIKIGLDNVNTGVMIADNTRTIIYANKSVVKLLSKAETNIKKQLPNFSATQLIGANIDSFHKNPALQAQLLSSLTASYTASMILGDNSMVVSANPVISEQGCRLGWVAEWHDRTVEVAVEKELSTFVVAATMGDFSKRFDLRGKEGFLREVGEGLNQLLYTSEIGLNEVARVLGALSRGDLTEKITRDYSGTFGQLKDDSNATVEKLNKIVSQIKEAADNINSSAKDIASGNIDLSYRTEQQASSLQQTAATMTGLNATVQANTTNANHANTLAVGASEIATQGVKVIGKVVTTMEGINEAAHKIVTIISVINDIAFQTNILALNAAVEAARAGEQGHGFAVVAQEVRNLAQRAAAAAGDIKVLIDNSVEKVEDGTQLVAQAGLTMKQIVNAIHGVTAMMSEISAASVAQSNGISQVNKTISQMDDVTQQNAALVEQAAAAAESLEEQAQSLVSAVGSFIVDANQHIPFNSETASIYEHISRKNLPVRVGVFD